MAEAKYTEKQYCTVNSKLQLLNYYFTLEHINSNHLSAQ
jgi:hypothetical protein